MANPSKNTNLITRVARKGQRLTACKYRIIALALNKKGELLGIVSNRPRFKGGRNYHAEEVLLHKINPKIINTIYIFRINFSNGIFQPIDPCTKCRDLCNKYGIKVRTLNKKLQLTNELIGNFI